MQKLLSLTEKIETLKKILSSKAMHGNLSTQEILRISEKMDSLIIEYYRLKHPHLK